jgi:hypothetical protein
LRDIVEVLPVTEDSDVAFTDLIRGLRQTEHQLLKQLESVRGAISSLEMGSAVSPAVGPRRRKVRARRTLSAKARAAISRAQKARWAKQKSAAKK